MRVGASARTPVRETNASAIRTNGAVERETIEQNKQELALSVCSKPGNSPIRGLFFLLHRRVRLRGGTKQVEQGDAVPDAAALGAVRAVTRVRSRSAIDLVDLSSDSFAQFHDTAYCAGHPLRPGIARGRMYRATACIRPRRPGASRQSNRLPEAITTNSNKMPREFRS